MDKSIISVVLLPDEHDKRQLIDFSAVISETASSVIKLGEGFLPHITVAQFLAPSEASAELWSDVKGLNKNVDSLTSTGVTFIPDTHMNGLWVELSFLKSMAIRQLQEDVLKTSFSQRFELHNGRGDAYRPHCTLALLADYAIPKMEIENLNIFKRPFNDLTLAVGANGENFTFSKAEYS